MFDTKMPLFAGSLLEKALKERFFDKKWRFWPASGGDTALSGVLQSEQRRLFAKFHPEGSLLQAEACGLTQLGRWVDVPDVIACVEVEAGAVLLLSFRQLRSLEGQVQWHQAGEHLANLHACRSEWYGAMQDNYVGGSAQSNASMACWPDFFREQRLAPQLTRARRRGLDGMATRYVEQVMGQLEHWLPAAPAASLLHGDLWQGNLAWGERGPVFFDPACYYGDPQVDLAMLNLFGRAPAAFYHGYQGRLPDTKQQRPWPVYDLYHWLKEPLNNSLHAQSFRLIHNLGALLKACWLPVEKVQ
ncbi:MAG: hypothetical protein CL537_00685, partial [Alcanivoracaceae bacterium]|nr:hypothetical protein [Alcanivoracaceae bacterium]